MQAIVFQKPHSLAIETVADPAPQADEVVIRVARAGICGTDLHIYRNEYFSDFPLIPGHEFCGEVVEVGGKVQSLRVGRRVAVDPNLYCNRCVFCRQQHNNHCLNWQGVGITRPGAFAQYVAVPENACYPLPESLTDLQAAFIEPLSCVIHALNRLRVWPGDDALIFGAGPMGLVLIQALRHSGAARIVVVEKQPPRLELARHMGAATAVPADAELERALRELAPHGFAVVVDATGVPEVIESAFRFLKPRGQFLQFGVAPMDAHIRLSPYQVFKNDWTILGSFALCYTFQRAIEWLAGGIVEIEPIISHTVPLQAFPDVFAQFARGEILKVHVLPEA